MMLHKGAAAKLQSTGRLATAPWGKEFIFCLKSEMVI